MHFTFVCVLFIYFFLIFFVTFCIFSHFSTGTFLLCVLFSSFPYVLNGILAQSLTDGEIPPKVHCGQYNKMVLLYYRFSTTSHTLTQTPLLCTFSIDTVCLCLQGSVIQKENINDSLTVMSLNDM